MADDSMEEDAVEMTKEKANIVKARFLLRDDVYIFIDQNDILEKRIAKLQNELKKNPSDKKKQEEFKQAITASDQLTIKARDDLNEVLAW